MEENEIIYIPYGLDEISLLDLMTSLADGVESYLGSKRWAKKDKYRLAWLNAYLDIINRGITGASNDSGIWKINHKGDNFTLDTMSNTEREMYQDAAYYIQLKMALMPPRKKEEEKKKEDLEKYGDFRTNLMNQILKGYGNNSELFKDSKQGWDAQDDRGADGLRGTEKRRAAMIEALKTYKDSLNNKDYNFEETPFKDKADLQTKIQAAIDALGTDEETDDLPAFNALGLPYKAFFNNGGNDPYTKGSYKGTYAGYNEYLAEQNKIKQKAEQEKLKLQRANQYTNFRFYGQGLVGTPPSGNDALQRLNTYVSLPKLDGNQQSELVGAFKFAEKNGILQNLSKEELLKFGSRWMSSPSRLKKINGLNGFYWDSIGQRVVQPYNQSNVPTTGFLDLVNLNSPESKQALIKSQLVKQMNQPIQGSLNLSDLSNFGFDEATGNELWAVINDIGAFVDPEAISGTALALNAARLRDKNREGWSWERVLDWGTSALGGLPVIGDAASVVKAGSNLVKLANRSARVGSFIGMAFSAVNMPEAWDSIKKIYDKGITSMTPQDILNITYGLMGLFAGIKTINAVNARQKPQTITEHSIEIDGKKVKLPDQATANKVSAEYKAAKNNTEASLKVVKMQEVREAAKKAGIEVTDASKVTSGSGFLRGNLVSRKLGMSKSPVKSELVYTGEMTGGSASGYYMPSWRRSFLNLEQKEIKNPLRKTFDWFLGKTPEVKSTESPKIESELKQSSTSKVSKENIKTLRENEEFKQYRDLMDYKKKDSSRGVLKDGTEHTVEFGGKSYNFKYDGKTHSITINGKQIKVDPKEGMEGVRKEVSKFIQQLRKTTINSKKITKEELKEIVAKLKELKKKGFLKQGGTLNNSYIDNVIEDFLKNNNI